MRDSPVLIIYKMKKTVSAFIFLVVYFIKMYMFGVYALIKEKIEGHFHPPEPPDGEGLVALVTGGTEGIGSEIVNTLLSKNVTVFIASRDKEKGENLVRDMKLKYSNAQVYHLVLDLRSLKSVRNCFMQFKKYKTPLHILINNAGVMLTPHRITDDGFEEQFEVNYLSHYYLTLLLLDKLKLSGSRDRASRIINVSSAVHRIAGEDLEKLISRCSGLFEYSPHYAYATSKLAIILSSYNLARHLNTSRSCVTINSLHPGVVNTGLYRHTHWSIRWLMLIIAKLLFKTPKQAAESVIYVAMATDLEGISGCYYDNCKAVNSSDLSYDQDLQDELLSRTVQNCFQDMKI